MRVKMKLDEAKKSKGKKDLEQMESTIEAMKAEGLSDDEIAKVFTELEDEALETIIQKLKVEGYSDDEVVEYLKEAYEDEQENEGEEPGSVVNPADAIAIAALDQEPAKVAEYFDNAIRDRLSDMVGEYKTHIANNLFTDPPQEEPNKNDDEDTDRWEDNGGTPNDENETNEDKTPDKMPPKKKSVRITSPQLSQRGKQWKEQKDQKKS
jgi:DNA-binding transcriptional regulator YhcF (GntR family)